MRESDAGMVHDQLTQPYASIRPDAMLKSKQLRLVTACERRCLYRLSAVVGHLVDASHRSFIISFCLSIYPCISSIPKMLHEWQMCLGNTQRWAQGLRDFSLGHISIYTYSSVQEGHNLLHGLRLRCQKPFPFYLFLVTFPWRYICCFWFLIRKHLTSNAIHQLKQHYRLNQSVSERNLCRSEYECGGRWGLGCGEHSAANNAAVITLNVFYCHLLTDYRHNNLSVLLPLHLIPSCYFWHQDSASWN